MSIDLEVLHEEWKQKSSNRSRRGRFELSSDVRPTACRMTNDTAESPPTSRRSCSRRSPLQTTKQPCGNSTVTATMLKIIVTALLVFDSMSASVAWIPPPTTRTSAQRSQSTIDRRSTCCVVARHGPRYLLKLPDEEDIDNFLDTPFYDPDKVLEDDESSESSKRFAMFVKNDYETAEALLAGAFFVVLVVVAQELLRMHIYGDSYVPFTSGGSVGGRLF